MDNNNGQPQDLLVEELDGIRQIEIEGYEQGVKKGRNTLFVIGTLSFIVEMYMMFNSNTGFSALWLIIALFEAGIFIALGFWTKKKPYYAIIAGIVVYIGLWILAGIYDPNTLLKGVLIKIFIVGYLIGALSSAKELQRVKEEDKLINGY